MIVIFSGLPGSGKSMKLGQTVIDILYRNVRWYKRTGQIRKVYLNLKMSSAVEEHFKDFVVYWSDLRQLTPLRDADIIIDEVATYFDARLWDTLSLEMRRFLSQHRKFGVEIYGTTQDFAQVDKAFRRLTSNLIHLQKLFGSGDISPTKPAPRFIFGLVLEKELDPTVYDEVKSKFAPSGVIPKFSLITRRKTQVFDTRAEVQMSSALPLKHIERVCERNNCPFHKVQHV